MMLEGAQNDCFWIIETQKTNEALTTRWCREVKGCLWGQLYDFRVTFGNLPYNFDFSSSCRFLGRCLRRPSHRRHGSSR